MPREPDPFDHERELARSRNAFADVVERRRFAEPDGKHSGVGGHFYDDECAKLVQRWVYEQFISHIRLDNRRFLIDEHGWNWKHVEPGQHRHDEQCWADGHNPDYYSCCKWNDPAHRRFLVRRPALDRHGSHPHTASPSGDH